MCHTRATSHEAKRKTVSIITVKAATQVSTLECADVLPADVSPQYSPTSPPAEVSLNFHAMDRAEQVTDSLVEKKRLPAMKGTMKTQFSRPSPTHRFFELPYLYSKFFLHRYLRYFLVAFSNPIPHPSVAENRDFNVVLHDGAHDMVE